MPANWHEGCLHISIPPAIKQRSGKRQLFDFPSNEEEIGGREKRKWVEVMPMAVWSHNTTVCRATNFTPFQLMYGTKAMLPGEIKHRSVRVTVESIPCPSEAEEKDMLESDKLNAVTNLEKYQE
jgi:hypothetical protein